jgi:hypothetical protein
MTTMAKMRTGALRKLHADLGQILADYDASREAESAENQDNPRDTGKPRNPNVSGQDSARTMRKLIPGYDRLSGASGVTTPSHGLRVNARQIDRNGNEVK